MVERQIFREMRMFQVVRFKWLLDLEPPRSTTVLVEGIPDSKCSDHALKAYFEMLFPGAVESAYIVRHTRQLSNLVEELKARKLALEKAKFSKTKAALAGSRATPQQEELVAKLQARCSSWRPLPRQSEPASWRMGSRRWSQKRTSMESRSWC